MARVAVLGAGNGGLAAIADLAVRGHDVRLWNRGAGALAEIARTGAVEYGGVLGRGVARVGLVTIDLAAAVSGAELILVTLPALAHDTVARALAPHLRPGQSVVLDPGGLLGSVAFARALREHGFGGPLSIGETGTLSYICRKTGPAAVDVTSVATDLPFAALPGRATLDLAARVADVLPGLRPLPHVLAAGITSINTVLHPPGIVLGAAWIERTEGDFAYYADTAVPSVARLMAGIDAERLAVARAWGVEAEPFLEVFARIGSTSRAAAESGDFQRALEDSLPNRSIRAPKSLDSRYLHEDIPFGVVPLADLGAAAGVRTPILDAIITVTSTITGRDYRAEGRSLERLGYGGLPISEILDRLTSLEP